MPKIKHPHVIEIELTNKCNMACIHCHRNYVNRNIGFMKLSVFKTLIDEISHYPVAFLRVVGLGESSLHPQFNEMMLYASGKSIKIEITTNGTLFDLFSYEEIMKWGIDIIGVSIDGVDKSAYQKIRRGGNFDRLATNIYNFYEYRNKEKRIYPMICIRNVIFPDNTHQQIMSFNDQWIKTADQVTFNTLQRQVQSNIINRYKRCQDVFFSAHINYDGSVRECGFQYLYGNNNVIGNLENQNLAQIWQSNRLKSIRLLHYKRNFPAACILCHLTNKKDLEYENARKYNASKNKVIKTLNKVFNVT